MEARALTVSMMRRACSRTVMVAATTVRHSCRYTIDNGSQCHDAAHDADEEEQDDEEEQEEQT